MGGPEDRICVALSHQSIQASTTGSILVGTDGLRKIK